MLIPSHHSTRSTLLVLVTALLSAWCIESRMVSLHKFLTDTFQFQARPVPALEERIDALYLDSAFPKAGRTLKQKIREAERFLATEVPKSGIVGVGAAIVYRDHVVHATGYGLQSSTNATSLVNRDSLFQIGSVTKTMIAVAVGLLVEDGKVQWRDPVKQHLPWLVLADKYAETYVTIGDLLAMNSGFGPRPDMGDLFRAFATEREYIEAIKDVPPEHSLREEPDYANVNFVILGQLLESVSGLSWDVFLRERLWKPLNMTHTFASAALVSSAVKPWVNAGHYACAGEATLGPYDLVESRETWLNPGRKQQLNAAGSVVSSAADMATFMRLILNKGHVNGVTLLKNPATIGEMITGKALASAEVSQMIDRMGLRYSPDGSTLSAGYGIDIIGHVAWGHAYFDKSGDVATHQTRTGFVPGADLGVILMGNTQVPSAHASFFLDHYRTYLLGIFLDVPKHILDYAYAKWRAADVLQPELPGVSACGFTFMKEIPSLPWTERDVNQLVGTYEANVGPLFFPKVEVTRNTTTNSTALHIAIGAHEGPLTWFSSLDSTTRVLVASLAGNPQPFVATIDAEHQFTLELGITYTKKTV